MLSAMSISTLANLEGRHVYATSVTGRELGEGAYTDLQLRAGGGSNDTAKVSFQVYETDAYSEKASINRRGLNIEGLVVRDTIVFDRGDGTTDEQRAGSISGRRDDGRSEMSIDLSGTGPGKRVALSSKEGLRVSAPLHAQQVLRARDLRLHGKGASFAADGVDAAYVRAVDGAMTFDGAHSGYGDFARLRMLEGEITGEFVARDKSRMAFEGPRGHRWSMSVDNESAFVLEGTPTKSTMKIVDGVGDAAFEVRHGRAHAREALEAPRVEARTLRVHDRLRAHGIDASSANVHAATVHELVGEHADLSTLEAGAVQTGDLSVDRDAHVSGAFRARSVRADGALESSELAVSGLARAEALDLLAHARIGGDVVVSGAMRSATAASPLTVDGGLRATEAVEAKNLRGAQLAIADGGDELVVRDGVFSINGQRALELSEGGHARAPFLESVALTVDERAVAPLLKTSVIEATAGFDTGNIDILAKGINLGNIRIDSDAVLELIGSAQHSGILEMIARNGVLIRSGDDTLGEFEPAMWQVIAGQGVRQSGSLYMITPGTGRYVKFEPPAADDEVMRMYVNAEGQSIKTFETEPDETRIPQRLYVGSEVDPTGNATPVAGLRVRYDAAYGGPAAIIHGTNDCADAEMRVLAESNVASLGLETATGYVRIEHRSDANELAFFNNETANDFLVVDTITGLARVAGDLVVGGSLFFGNLGSSAGGGGSVSFDQGVEVRDGNITIGNVVLDAVGDNDRELLIDATRVMAPSLTAGALGITEPANGARDRTLAFNAYDDANGVLRHASDGSAATLEHEVRLVGETTPSSIKMGFSSRTIVEDAPALPQTAFEFNDDGELYARNLGDSGFFEFKQNTVLDAVQVQTSRAKYTFDKNVDVYGDIRAQQSTGGESQYHALRSTEDGLLLMGNPPFMGNGDPQIPAALVIGDGQVDGPRWRFLVDSGTGHLVFEHQTAPGGPWSSKFRMVSE